jgi:AraC-like DNA-binding protein
MNSLIIVPGQDAIHDMPHPLLRPFISQYTFRSIHLPAGNCLEKAMPLRLVNSIDFFIGDAFETIDCHSGDTVPFIRCTVRGPRTGKKYLIRLRGHFASFTIKFHATGMYRLLGIPMDNFRDKAVPGADIGVLALGNLTEQLLYADDISTCIAIAEPYLLRLASGRGVTAPGSTAQVVGQLLQQKGSVSIASLAIASNLSIRQLERNFIKEIGVSPKTYSRMLRFVHLLQNKMTSPHQKWAALAYDADYFDQMHLVKEFKQFLGTTPSSFIPADFAF